MKNKWSKAGVAALAILFIGMVVYTAFTYEQVPGADEKISEVVQEYAEKAGVQEREPFINTDKGDILLFLFCLSGLVAGFYLGYHWKQIVSEKPDIKRLLEQERKKTEACGDERV